MVLLRSTDLRLGHTSDPPGGGTVAAATPSRPSDTSFVLGRSGAQLEQLIPPFKEGLATVSLTRGAWSFHDMILFAAGRLGPCSAWVSSWSISERPIRQLLRARSEGLFTELRFLLDGRVKSECAAAYQLLLSDRSATVHLCKNHSKLAVLRAPGESVVIISTANLTVNPRLEAYDLIVSTSTADVVIDLLTLEMDAALPFTDE